MLLRRIFGLPSTTSGWASIGLIVLFALTLWLFFYFVRLGLKGGQTFFSNPVLAWTILAAGAAAVAGGVCAAIAIIRGRDFSVLVFVSLAIGLFVLWFAVGESLGHDTPHGRGPSSHSRSAG